MPPASPQSAGQVQRTFTPDVVHELRSEIAAANGNEVFFVGTLNERAQVAQVSVAARGSHNAVPAVAARCEAGGVVIHNHPSGDLRPSSPDISIAAQLATLSVAFYIVDNSVNNVYRVVEPLPQNKIIPLDLETIGRCFAPDGRFAAALSGYEERPEQLRMALTVAEAFNRDRLALVEAGTGTGKSLAYLLPAVLWSTSNRERVIVSTNTINLQEQLISKDIPLLRHASGVGFRAALLKGRSNYLCRRRLEDARQEPDLLENAQKTELERIAEWSLETRDGSRASMPFAPSETVWEEVCCELDQCLHVLCPFFGDCFLQRARRLAAQADLLVVNHALLMADLAIRAQSGNYSATALLPASTRLILDEAHHLEDGATRFFSSEVTRFGFVRLLNRLRHPRKVDAGFLPRLLNSLSMLIPSSENALYVDFFETVQKLAKGGDRLREKAISTLEDVAFRVREFMQQPQGDLRLRVTGAFAVSGVWEAIREKVLELESDTCALAKGLRGLIERCGDLEGEKLAAVLVDVSAAAGRLERLAASLRLFVDCDEEHCVWMEVTQGRIGRASGVICRLCVAPLTVAPLLREHLFGHHKTVVLTSATLAVRKSFGYFRARVGLAEENARLGELQLASPFDFPNQALVALPNDLPDPNSDTFPAAARDLCERAILAADGRTFVLFTAYTLLKRVFAEAAPSLRARGYRCLCQGDDSRHRLLQTFVSDPTSVLFATDSFWEGVDVPGRALEQIIIVKLPFRVPTEPIQQARVEALQREGGDPFREYTVPQAVIRFKQGFGRLIRSRSDRGVVLILDSRVVNKYYGALFLDSLPETRRAEGDTQAVLSAMRQFFGEG